MSGIAHSRSSPVAIAGDAGGHLVSNTSMEEQKNGEANKAVKKRSLDYVLRSGLAGGLAGCAVSAQPLVLPAQTHANHWSWL